MVKKYKDILIYFTSIVLGIGVWVYSDFSIGGKKGFLIDGRIFPKSVALCIVVAGVVGLIMAFISMQRTANSESSNRQSYVVDKKAVWRTAVMALIILVYAFVLETVGFIASTIVVVGIVLWLVHVRKVWSYVTVYAVCAAIYCIFTFVLNVRLP